MKLRLSAVRRVAVRTGAAALTAVVAADASASGDTDTFCAPAAARTLKIGTAVHAGALTSESGYQDRVRYGFGSVTPENAMKWALVEPRRNTYDWTSADAVVDFATAHNESVRGHTLVWGKSLPGWLTDGVAQGTIGDAQLKAILQSHITTLMKRYAGRVGVWDVVNEALAEDGTVDTGNFWYRHLGEAYIADAFTWAHAADPAAKLYLNDFDTEPVNSKSDGLYTLVKKLRAAGVPIDGVGFQTHVTTDNTLHTLRANLRRFADLGLDVAITELDVRMPLPPTDALLTTQADIYATATEACLAVSRCVSLTVWGFSDAYSWVPAALPGWGAADLLDQGLRPKPAYAAVHAALDDCGFTTTTTAAARHSAR
ncbi:endo-1,4-beta-xylanase [Streptomyces sp.]|uniref:endo-1,4-beta-xylanase n=1 Tax=Streptomyces sp. TaxID=1931 RepID=UPI002F41548B